jgi:DnaJ-class molecular chaperone
MSAEKRKPCPRCKGQGMIPALDGMDRKTAIECPDCKRTGYAPEPQHDELDESSDSVTGAGDK